jgi:hypothetical protein
MPHYRERDFPWVDETVYRVRRASRSFAIDDDRRSLDLGPSPLDRTTTGVLLQRRMLRFRFRITDSLVYRIYRLRPLKGVPTTYVPAYRCPFTLSIDAFPAAQNCLRASRLFAM